MVFNLRPYQSKMKSNVSGLWQTGVNNPLAVLPTGGGKTVIFSDILREHTGIAVAIAHRQELVSQMSNALAGMGVYHNIVGSQNVIKNSIRLHQVNHGKPFFHPSAPITVAGVDTLIRRDLDQWCKSVSLWIMDEAHHVLRANKWGKAVNMFPNANGLGVTATPLRADGKGLGAHADGVFQVIVEGPTMRELIQQGNLSDYRIFAPPSDLQLDQVAVSGATGDFNAKQLRDATHKSHIVGDVVEHYQRIAPGKLGVTFAVDVETATDIANQFNTVGVPAAVVSAKTPDNLRIELVQRFARRELLQLVNVDLFGEGFDLPAIEVVSMARPTQSYALYAQQFGRALRPMEGKTEAIIIDHVGNVTRHNLPDAPRHWSLDARERRSNKDVDPDDIPLKPCENCFQVYERFRVVCPHCGHKPEPAGRSTPTQVDGDLMELDADALARMRGAISTTHEPPEDLRNRMQHAGANQVAINSASKNRLILIAEHERLESVMQTWGGKMQATGLSRSEAWKQFYLRFGIDALSAQTLSYSEALKLREKLECEI